MATVRAQVYDLAEEYTVSGYEQSVQCIRVYGLTQQGRTVSVLVTDTPHEIYVDPSKESGGLMDLVSELNTHLLKSPSQCVRTDCTCYKKPNSFSGGNTKKFAPSYQSCIRDRKTDRTAVLGTDQVRRRGFEVYEAEDRVFWRFFLSRSYYAKPAKRFFENRGLDVYECCSDPVQSFIQLKNFAGFEWYEWPAGSTVSFNDFIEAEWVGMAPFRNMCFDIETIAQTYNNVETEKASYPVGCLCNDDGSTKRAYVLGAQITGYEEGEIQHYESELKMLRAVRDDFFAAHIWSGWNSDKFDIPYVFKRAEALGDADFRKLRDGRVVRFLKDEDSGAGTVYCPGFLFMDYCSVVQADTRITPYDHKLNTMSEYFGIGAKDDMPYDKIHGAFYGSTEERGKLVKYCGQDVSLTTRIGKMIGAFVKLVAKSRVKRIRPQDELYRGAAFVTLRKVKQYLRSTHVMLSPREEYVDGKRRRILCDALKEVDGLEKLLSVPGFPGGFVRDPLTGVYTEFTVGTLDFNSLYPSIIRTYNMCSSTLLPRPGTLPEDKEWVSTSGFAFAQEPEGIIPKIMRDMVSERNKVRANIKTTTDPDELEQLDALQTEYKIVANSLYGQTGASTSALFMKAIAQCTCERGAELAQLACHLIDANPGISEEWDQRQTNEYIERMQSFEDGLRPMSSLRFLLKRMRFKILMGLEGEYDDEGALHMRTSKESTSAEQREDWMEEIEAFEKELKSLSMFKFRLNRARFKVIMGLKVIYGDTDSLMINFPKSKDPYQTLGWLNDVGDYINKESGILGTKGILKMGAEDVSRMILAGKKMYVKHAMTIDDDGNLKKPKLKIKGMDTRGKSPFVRERMRTMFEAALSERKDITKMYEETIQMVALGKVDFKQMKHTTVLNKSLDQYGNEAHAVAARQMVAAGLPVTVGDRIEYYRCLIINSGSKKADCVVASDLVKSGGYDLDWREYALESIKAMEKSMELLIPEKTYKKVSDIKYYHIRIGCKKYPPPQASFGALVGDKVRKLTAQSGPMDGFIKRTKSDKPKPKSKVQKAQGRGFDDMELDDGEGAE